MQRNSPPPPINTADFNTNGVNFKNVNWRYHKFFENLVSISNVNLQGLNIAPHAKKFLKIQGGTLRTLNFRACGAKILVLIDKC